MFDALLGRKFTVKCKQAIKCINERLKPIRNRKQAMLNFLKQDIAELLRCGHDCHAFKRMDALIVEINHLACYDLVHKFCECILKQLPLLQKQRECPSADREAVSTLIFAAARFSDLPELCNLRRVFMARYGDAMETYLNLEFKDKLASKTFLMAKKIQLMRDIARDFSINWDSESFEYRITHPMAAECEDGKSSDGMYDTSINIVKHVLTEAKDIRVIGPAPEPTRNSKIFLDEPENVSPHPPDPSVPPYVKPKTNKDGNHVEDQQKKGCGYRKSSRVREVLEPIDPECKVFEAVKSKDDCRARSKLTSHVKLEPVGIHAEDWHGDHTTCSRPTRARGKLDPLCQEDDDVIEQLKSKDENKNGNTMSALVKRQESIDVDTKRQNDNYTISKRPSEVTMNYKGEWRQAAGQYEFEDVEKPIKVSNSKPKGINGATESDDNRVQAVGEQKLGDYYDHIKAPPYFKPKAVKDTHLDDWDTDDVVKGTSAKGSKDADLSAQEELVIEPFKSNNNSGFHMIPPPYVKRNVSAIRDHAMSSSSPTYRSGFAATVKPNHDQYGDGPKDELVVDDERMKPRLVGRKHHKTSVVQETDSTVDVVQPTPRIPHRQRRHAAKQRTFVPQDDYDSEEEVLDRLLIHYSKKGMPHQTRKHIKRTQPHLAAHVVDESEAGQHPDDRYHHINRPESALPPYIGHVDDNRTVQCRSDGRLYAHLPESVEGLADHFVDDSRVGKHQTLGRHVMHKPESTHDPMAHGTNRDEARPRRSNGGRHIGRSEASQSLPAEAVYLVASGQHQSYHRDHAHKPKPVHPPERAVSLPPNPVSPEEKVKCLTRAATMQPGPVNSPGGRTHPRLPDFEELAARIAALKKG